MKIALGEPDSLDPLSDVRSKTGEYERGLVANLKATLCD